ncbi:PIN domain-containing protein [Micromonospora sp. NPDC050795]|uniref:PIN domain-containing protein n=1 Tax=Micromonospora sp. NPDC050795 TaxID=3364282 RepID=UPI0037AFE095
MLVTLTPGVARDRALQLLRSASLEITNNHGQQDKYVQWVLDTSRMLRGQIAQSDLEQLLLTPAFYRLIDPTLMGTPQGLLLLNAEITERQAMLTQAADTLHAQLNAWDAAARLVLAVVDSSVFLSHPCWTRDDDPAAVLASIPWADELGARAEDILLVLPEVVIRELDRIKESSNKTLRHRAQVTLAVIDRLLPDPSGTVMIRPEDGWDEATSRGQQMPRGAVHLRIFYDDPAHRPLSDPDAEIIDRAIAVQTLAGKPAQLMTMDTTMGLNARRAGLQVAKPIRKIDEPPAEGQSTRARRRAAAEGADNSHTTSDDRGDGGNV